MTFPQNQVGFKNPGQVVANSVVIFGTQDGLFIYNGVPASGNPPVAWATPPGVNIDPYGNSLPLSGGYVSSLASGALASLIGGALGFFSDNPSSFIAAEGGISMDDAILASSRPALDISPPTTVGPANPAGTIILFAQSNDASKPAQVQIAASGNPAAPSTTALLEVDGNMSVPGATLTAGAININLGNLDIQFPGTGLKVKEGSNCKQGTATLVAGTVVVANTSVTASSRIFLTAQDANTAGVPGVSARVPGTSFTINTNNAVDHGVIAYEIFEPG